LMERLSVPYTGMLIGEQDEGSHCRYPREHGERIIASV
jgi:hypothetical protein